MEFFTALCCGRKCRRRVEICKHSAGTSLEGLSSGRPLCEGRRSAPRFSGLVLRGGLQAGCPRGRGSGISTPSPMLGKVPPDGMVAADGGQAERASAVSLGRRPWAAWSCSSRPGAAELLRLRRQQQRLRGVELFRRSRQIGVRARRRRVVARQPLPMWRCRAGQARRHT